MPVDYKKILAYTGFESLLCQSILCLHQSLLYVHLPADAYGIIGTIFSLVYLSVTIANSGLDQIIAQYYHVAMRSIYAYKAIILKQAWYNIASSALVGIAVCYYIQQYMQLSTLHLLACIAALIAIESYKKSCKTMLQLMLYYRLLATGELIHNMSYVACFWFAHAMGMPITLLTCIVPLITISSLQAICYSIVIARTIRNLPAEDPHDSSVINYKQIHKDRLIHYLYQLTRLIYASNFLIPLFAITQGPAIAGFLKFISTIVHSINGIIRHAFTTTCMTIFATTKNGPEHDTQKVFLSLEKVLAIIIMSMIIGCCGIHFYALWYHTYLTAYGTIGMLFALLLILEYAVIPHEQCMLIAGNVYFLLASTSIIYIPVIAMYKIALLSPTYMLFVCIAARCLSHGALVYYTGKVGRYGALHLVLTHTYRLLRQKTT